MVGELNSFLTESASFSLLGSDFWISIKDAYVLFRVENKNGHLQNIAYLVIPLRLHKLYRPFKQQRVGGCCLFIWPILRATMMETNPELQHAPLVCTPPPAEGIQHNPANIEQYRNCMKSFTTAKCSKKEFTARLATFPYVSHWEAALLHGTASCRVSR